MSRSAGCNSPRRPVSAGVRPRWRSIATNSVPFPARSVRNWYPDVVRIWRLTVRPPAGERTRQNCTPGFRLAIWRVPKESDCRCYCWNPDFRDGENMLVFSHLYESGQFRGPARNRWSAGGRNRRRQGGARGFGRVAGIRERRGRSSRRAGRFRSGSAADGFATRIHGRTRSVRSGGGTNRGGTTYGGTTWRGTTWGETTWGGTAR